jgi:cytochrome b561
MTQTHKCIGVTVLALTVMRLFLRILWVVPKPEPIAPLLLTAAKAAHIALYTLLLVTPFVGAG